MPTWTLEQWNGGVSTGDKVGIPGSFYWGENLDIHGATNKLQIMPKPTKDSGSVVTDLPHFFTSEGVNNDIFALGSAGGFYKKASGTWTKDKTLGGGNGQGLGNFNNIIYFASGNNLGTYNPSTAAYNESYQSLDTADWHPMVQFLDKIMIGNGQYVSSVDGSGIWSQQNLVLQNDYRVKSMEVVGGGNWLLIGTEKLDKSDAKLFFWDGYATNYNDVIMIKEHGINAILNSDSVVLVQAGVVGNLYQCTGDSLVKIKQIPFLTRSVTASTYPGAVVNHQGNSILGVSAGTSTVVKRGVYSWTAAEKNYSKVLNLAYTPSHGTLTGASVQIGALYSEGQNELYVGWYDGTNYGIDLIDGSGIATTAEYQSLIYDAGVSENVKFFHDIKIRLARPLRTGESVDLYYDADRSGSWTQIKDSADTYTMNYTEHGAIVESSQDVQIRANEIQLRLMLRASNNTSPAIDSVISQFQVEELL